MGTKCRCVGLQCACMSVCCGNWHSTVIDKQCCIPVSTICLGPLAAAHAAYVLCFRCQLAQLASEAESALMLGTAASAHARS